MDNQSFETLAVHAGEDRDKNYGAVSVEVKKLRRETKPRVIEVEQFEIEPDEYLPPVRHNELEDFLL